MPDLVLLGVRIVLLPTEIALRVVDRLAHPISDRLWQRFAAAAVPNGEHDE